VGHALTQVNRPPHELRKLIDDSSDSAVTGNRANKPLSRESVHETETSTPGTGLTEAANPSPRPQSGRLDGGRPHALGAARARATGGVRIGGKRRHRFARHAFGYSSVPLASIPHRDRSPIGRRRITQSSWSASGSCAVAMGHLAGGRLLRSPSSSWRASRWVCSGARRRSGRSPRSSGDIFPSPPPDVRAGRVLDGSRAALGSSSARAPLIPRCRGRGGLGHSRGAAVCVALIAARLHGSRGMWRASSEPAVGARTTSSFRHHACLPAHPSCAKLLEEAVSNPVRTSSSKVTQLRSATAIGDELRVPRGGYGLMTSARRARRMCFFPLFNLRGVIASSIMSLTSSSSEARSSSRLIVFLRSSVGVVSGGDR